MSLRAQNKVKREVEQIQNKLHIKLVPKIWIGWNGNETHRTQVLHLLTLFFLESKRYLVWTLEVSIWKTLSKRTLMMHKSEATLLKWKASKHKLGQTNLQQMSLINLLYQLVINNSVNWENIHFSQKESHPLEGKRSFRQWLNQSTEVLSTSNNWTSIIVAKWSMTTLLETPKTYLIWTNSWSKRSEKKINIARLIGF